MADDEGINITEQRIAYRDIDMLGQMHNSAYLTLAEQALVAFWGHRPPVEKEPAFIVKRIECTFHAPLRYGDLVRLRVVVDKIGMSSVGFAVLIERNDERVARIEIGWTAFDRDRQEDDALPELIRDWLYDFLPVK